MSNPHNTFYKDIMSVAKSEFEKQNVSSKYDILAKSKFSGQSLSVEERDLGVQANALVEDIVDRSLNFILSKEEYAQRGTVLTEAQRAAAKMVVSLASNPKGYVNNMNKLTQPQAFGSNVVDVNSSSLGIEDYADLDIISGELSAEAYDGQKLNNAIYFSIAFNIGAARQDEFAEAFFPTITIDPAQSGINVSVDVATVYNEYNRSVNGDAPKEKYARIPVIKSVFNERIFGADKQRVVPVLREGTNDNTASFVAAAKYVDKSTGKDIVTAPLVFGKTLDILGISATDEMLAKGVLNNTDALDRTINLAKVYFQVQNDDATKTDIHAIDTTIYAYHNFVYNPQQHHKDSQLNFRANIGLNLSQLKKFDGSNSEVFGEVVSNGSYNDYVVVYDLHVVGVANTFNATVEVNGVKLEIAEIRNAAGQTLAKTDSAYTAIEAVAKTAKLLGYVLEANRTNSNVRTRGVLVTNDRYEYRYDVPLRSGVTAIIPTQNASGDDNDVNSVGDQILMAGIIISNFAVKTLNDYATAMNLASANNLLSVGEYASGIARHLVEPYFSTKSFDLSTIVDSINSATRREDIRATLIDNIRTEVINAYLTSNYGVAHDVIRGNLGGKVSVIIGTDPLIKSLLVKDDSVFALDADFEAHVVATKNPAVQGKIFVTFGVFDANRNSAPNPLNFGNNVWAPTISYEVTKTDSNAVSRELHNNPRFLHIIHLPVLSVFNITDVAEVFKKLPVHMKTQA